MFMIYEQKKNNTHQYLYQIVHLDPDLMILLDSVNEKLGFWLVVNFKPLPLLLHKRKHTYTFQQYIDVIDLLYVQPFNRYIQKNTMYA